VDSWRSSKDALLLRLTPKDFVVAVGVERRVNVNQVNAGVGQFGELFQIVAAINDAFFSNSVLSLWRLCEARVFWLVFLTWRVFLRGTPPQVSPYAACCYAIFFKLLIPALAGRFISGDEGHGTRQRPGYQVTPNLSLSCPMHAGNKTDLVQKMSPRLVKQAAYGETRAAIIKKKLMKNKIIS
jgi:hypothetical protein